MGAAFLEVDPAHATLKPDLLQYAEDRLSVATGGGRALRVYIDDRDHALQRAATTRGYRRTGDAEPMSRLTLPDPFPEARPPDGFRLRTLAEDNDLGKVHRLLWRGFDHGDEPPEAGLEERRFMQSAPGFRRDLNFVAEAPGGSFVAYCGVWFEPVHRIAYVEPVATDPDYRRRGLGRAVVMGAVRRCGEQGATVAFVGTATPFYLSLGFRQLYNCSVWLREWA
jgi:predicted N-acetyltransferase YhbS